MSLLANSNAIETGGYQISRSVRLRSSANGNFTRTPSSATNRRTWTWSAWVKRGLLSSGEQVLFSAGSSYTAQTYFTFYIGSDNKLVTSTGTAEIWRTTQVFRDPSAWYHVVLVVDTTQATADNRTRLYVNGAEVTSFTRGTNLSPNTDYGINYNIIHYIGRDWFQPIYFDGYLTEINFIDGQALTPSSFGETDTITGSWVAKKFTGTYGTNGFYLNFSDNSNNTSTTIGKDYSGNGNNWTPNNISVTAGTTYDSMLDVPSGNGYADGGNGRGNYCVLNPLILVPAGTISNGNLDYSRGSIASHGSAAASFTLPTTGKWYWEVTACSSANNEMIGIANIQNNPQLPAAGSEIGGGSRGDYGYRSDGNKYNNGNQGAYGATYASGNIIGVAWDSDAGTLVFYKNGTSQGTAFSSITQSAGKFAPAVSSAETSPDSFNFGQRPFSYAVPSGYSALNTTKLSDPTVKDGGDYFNTVLWTGNDATRTITGYGFQPDFIWTKGRNVAAGHRLSDVVRGASGGIMLNLSSNSTAAENTDTAITGFASDGFTMNGTNHPNVSPYTYVGWGWKANGTGVSNTAGTITSTVSANTTSGFSIVTYTGTGSAATVGHGLGVAPAMVMVKSRSNNTGDGFSVYHKSLPSADYWLDLATTGAQSGPSSAVWNGTAPTSTVFSVKTASGTNTNTYTYVAYCFAAVPGYSSFGSYTGNGSTDGPFVYTGFRPRYVFTKRTDTTGDWWVRDTARSPYNEAVQTLYLNSSAAEVGSGFDLLSNGFKPRTTDPTLNASGGTYIYAAFAEVPLKFSNAR